jgi:hypothetical protein
VIRGDDYVERFTIYSYTAGVKTAINLTGWSVEAKLTELVDGLEHTITSVIETPLSGIVKLSLPRSYTETLQTRNANWYLALINPADEKNTYIAGDAFFLTRGGAV